MYKLTGVLEEVKPSKVRENITKKEEINPMANLGKIISAYDIAQTQGRELRTVQLKEDTGPMETALTALLNFSPVQVVAGALAPAP